MKITDESGELIMREHVGTGKTPDDVKFEMSQTMGAPNIVIEIEGRTLVANFSSIVEDICEWHKDNPAKKKKSV